MDFIICCFKDSKAHQDCLNQASVAFGNEVCQRFRYEFYGSLYEIVGLPICPYGHWGNFSYVVNNLYSIRTA